MNTLRLSQSLATCVALAGIVSNAFSAAPAGEIIRGPVFAGTIRGKKSDEPIAMRGLVITVGDTNKAYVCYDNDLMRLSMAWTGNMLEFGNTQTQIAWPPPPKVNGTPVLEAAAGPGWAMKNSFTDLRPHQQGPLPRDWAKYRGYYQSGTDVVVSYTVGQTEILEMPGYSSDSGVFTRTFLMGPSQTAQTLSICRSGASSGKPVTLEPSKDQDLNYVVANGDSKLAVGLNGAAKGIKFIAGQDDVRLTIPASTKPTAFRIAIRPISGADDLTTFKSYLVNSSPVQDLKKLTAGGPTLWNQVVETKGSVSTEKGAYVVDTITEPTSNPWNAKTFFGGFDFLPDGRAVICTFHGDVWMVSGIDDKLKNLRWKRFATGLFQPLGVKVYNGQVFVLGRDQITILHDLNGDGEADFYENFNNDTVITANYHEFCLDLNTDSKGNFYFAKGAPWPPDVSSPHQGTMLRVLYDGSKLDVIATGLRAPNGSAVGPHDEITVSDNQGHWMPSSKLNLIKQGGFYGMVPAAQRPIPFLKGENEYITNPSDPGVRAEMKQKFWDNGSPIPVGYDKPMAWLPMNMDNSSGGQAWVTGRKWGPFENHLLFMSYGKCTLFNVMSEVVDGVTQAGMVQFPFKFLSGVMRGRFNPVDGQLYLCGLRGWQNAATRDGGFYRVRYTGEPVTMPVALSTKTTGVELTFATNLDPKSAADGQNYAVEMWNYRYTGGYGSPEVSVLDPNKTSHDKLEVKTAQVSPDGRKLFLEIPGLKPCDQLKIKINITAADGAPVAHEVYSTIYKLGVPTVKR